MVRAFAVCAVILAACTASAQTVTPRIISQPEPDEKLGIAIPEPTPVSACGEQDCSAPSVESSSAKPIDNHALLKQKLAEMNCLQSEIDQLRVATGTPQQILLKLKVVEVSRSKLRKLGHDIVGFTTIDDGKAVVEMLENLHQSGVARTLAEPTLVAISGRPAQFNVGGEVPLPTPPGSKQAVEFKQFGTQVEVLAIAQGDNRVRLDLRARIGEIDASKQIEVAGVTVPEISVRQVDTGLNLKFGQTGVLSGTVEKRIEQQKLEGKLVERVEEIELLFLVTPELVDSNELSQHTRTSGAFDAAAYRTATSESEERPNERSLRVTKPSAPR